MADVKASVQVIVDKALKDKIIEQDKIINQLEADKLELSKAIVEDNRKLDYFCELNRVYCEKCKGTETGEDGIIIHKDNCIVGKVEVFLGDRIDEV